MAPKQLAALLNVVVALEREAENYRDGDKYQPHGKTLYRLAQKARDALEPQRRVCDNCKRAEQAKDGRTDHGIAIGPCYCATLAKVAP